MSELNKELNPLSVTSDQSVDSMSTSSVASESDESNDFFEMSIGQERKPPLSMNSDQCIVKPSPDMSLREIFGPRSIDELSPTSTLVSVQSEESMDFIFLGRLNQGEASPASMCSDQVKDELSQVIDHMKAEVLSPYQRKQNSPAASYLSMKSHQSMNVPLKFSRDCDVTDSIPTISPTLTLQSEESVEPPHTVNCRVSCSSLMMTEHLRCSLCKYMLKEPVTIPCGHSFCKNCITLYWTKTAPDASHPCPQCRKRFKTRPVLNLNYTLANVVLTQQHLRISATFSAQNYARPGDVACDCCSGNKFRAVKSCLTCHQSFCETHVRQHYTVEALSKHTLTDPKVKINVSEAESLQGGPN